MTKATNCLSDSDDSPGWYRTADSLYVTSPQFSIAPAAKSGIAIRSTNRRSRNEINNWSNNEIYTQNVKQRDLQTDSIVVISTYRTSSNDLQTKGQAMKSSEG